MSSGLVAIADWLGHRGEPLNPESMQYTTREACSCRGCIFDGQRSAICARASLAAKKAGLPDCEEGGVIYVARELDPRQLVIAE